MKLAYEPRASTILYNLLVESSDHRPFLLPANICPIVPITFLKAGVPFTFVDISPVTLHIDLTDATNLLGTGRFGGLVYVHTYGEASTPDDFFASLKTADPTLLLIDDRCLCIPEFESDLPSQADVILYSTGNSKIADLDFGGYAFLRDEVAYRRHSIPFHPEDLEAVEKIYKRSITSRQRFIYRDCDWLETEADLPEWDVYRQHTEAARADALEQRRRINALYTECLPGEILLPAEYQTWRFNLQLPRRDETLAAIFKAGLFASAHYTSLAGILAPGACPNAEQFADQVINLFNDHHFTLEMAEKVCDIILKNMKK